MIKQIIAALIIVAVGACAAAAALENRGTESIVLDGGSRGVVPFPHFRHQEALADCNACHSLFPKEQGAIVRLKQEGQLVGKQIMNKHCIKCHRAEKKAGNKAGPVSCTKCHQKG